MSAKNLEPPSVNIDLEKFWFVFCWNQFCLIVHFSSWKNSHSTLPRFDSNLKVTKNFTKEPLSPKTFLHFWLFQTPCHSIESTSLNQPSTVFLTSLRALSRGKIFQKIVNIFTWFLYIVAGIHIEERWIQLESMCIALDSITLGSSDIWSISSSFIPWTFWDLPGEK